MFGILAPLSVCGLHTFSPVPSLPFHSYFLCFTEVLSLMWSHFSTFDFVACAFRNILLSPFLEFFQSLLNF